MTMGPSKRAMHGPVRHWSYSGSASHSRASGTEWRRAEAQRLLHVSSGFDAGATRRPCKRVRRATRGARAARGRWRRSRPLRAVERARLELAARAGGCARRGRAATARRSSPPRSRSGRSRARRRPAARRRGRGLRRRISAAASARRRCRGCDSSDAPRAGRAAAPAGRAPAATSQSRTVPTTRPRVARDERQARRAGSRAFAQALGGLA